MEAASLIPQKPEKPLNAPQNDGLRLFGIIKVTTVDNTGKTNTHTQAHAEPPLHTLKSRQQLMVCIQG